MDIISSGDTLISAEAPSEENTNTNTAWGDDGGTVTFTATQKVLSGAVACDANSLIDMALSDGSSLEGSVDAANEGDVSLPLDENNSWTATATSYVNSLNGVAMSGSTPLNVDASSDVVIYYTGLSDTDGNVLDGSCTLSSGGELQSGN